VPVTKADELLATLQTTIEATSEFVMKQAPPLAREIVLFGRVWLTIETVVFGIILWYCIRWYTSKEFVEYCDSFRSNQDFPVRSLVTGVAGIVSFCIFIASLSEATRAWLAPRYYILKKILGMVGSE